MTSRDVRGVSAPRFLYGTAWKEERTEALTRQALDAGFRGIDTANQRRHYFEEGVGAAIAGVPRDQLFLQTKFTSRGGQDHRLPYDPAADTATQVRQSFASSLQHLGTTVLDSYVLHGPSRRYGLAPEDWAVWRAMEELHQEKQARLLGVSNVSLDQLAALCADASVMPAFVQNRCFAATGWDRAVRAFCVSKDVVYQGFSLLTANAPVLQSRPVAEAARRTSRTPAQVVFRLALQLGMIPLTGTSSARHLREDLGALDFELTTDEVAAIECVAG